MAPGEPKRRPLLRALSAGLWPREDRPPSPAGAGRAVWPQPHAHCADAAAWRGDQAVWGPNNARRRLLGRASATKS